MALSEDQKAILRLLAQRGEEGYGDLAALIGISVEEVHAKAQEAAAQLESEGIPAPAIPAPPGAGATESPAPPPVERAEAKPEPAAPAKPEPTPAAPPESEPKPKRTPPPRPNISLPGGSGARAAIVVGALVLVALVVILIVGGGDDSGDAGTTTASERPVDATNEGETTRAVLAPVGGGDAEGLATFGRVKNSLALQVEATGLEPTGKGESYTIWLYESAEKMLPLASTRVPQSGQISAQVAVPTEVLGYLANETFDQIDISLTTDATLKASLAKATRERKAPIYTGTDVLRGNIEGPIIGAAKRGNSGG